MSNTLSRPPNGDDHVQGVGGAPIVLVEYGDYADAATGRAFEVVERLQLQLGDRLRFAFRHFPLVDAHPRAMPAALLAEAAADAGTFWSMHALLLAHQDRLEDDDLQRYAQQFGLPDTGGNRAHYQRIDRDLASGRASGVDGTPAFFVNGMRQDPETLAVTLGKVRNG
ncbi:thioredoxin domain-containing protein [Dactylosporangium sp. AC04546]|uniref:DsbA family protein n=1 Tax=Dactylosporangium sp. AC04546 TaxID=2862460 RepID=UPI001EDED4D2|nr:thioredoxin domain-containing protein [Dactylosporangium sp. AC04546]WVK82181.1 thioredoxin domain-containing protein [Dactylosporangium sp. AC04546]